MPQRRQQPGAPIRHHQSDFSPGKPSPDLRKRGRGEHKVTDTFELEDEDFHKTGKREE
jgi:hypothetical protein